MRKYKYIFISVISLMILYSRCGRPGNVTRTLNFVDLSIPENRMLNLYPREFSAYLLQAIYEKKLPVYYIDYLETGVILPLESAEFEARIIEPYELYDPDTENEYALPVEVDLKSFFSSVTLISFDVKQVEGNVYKTLYINFYHPGEITPEGYDTYICSIEYEKAIAFLQQISPPLVWHNYKLEDWGWVNKRVFKSDFVASSKMGFDILMYYKSNQQYEKLAPEILPHEIDLYLSQSPGNLHVILPDSGNLTGYVYYLDDSTTTYLASYSIDDLERMGKSKILPARAKIMPLTTALEEHNYKIKGKPQMISENGIFASPVKGKDKLTKRAGSKSAIASGYFDKVQLFRLRQIDRINKNDTVVLQELPLLLYDAIKRGEITVYEDDSLLNRLLSGSFFDALIFEDSNTTRMLKPELMKVHLIIRETIFDQEGSISGLKPLGIGLMVPGQFVPEGFNREAGYFMVDDINTYLTTNGREKIDFSLLSGFPLKSWNIEVYQTANR